MTDGNQNDHPRDTDDEDETPKTPGPLTGDEGARRAGSAEDDVTDPEGDE